MAMTPQERAALELFMDVNERVQVRLARHQQTLIREGLHRAEAWAMCQLIEERVMTRLMQTTASLLKTEKLLSEVLQEEIGRAR